MKKILCFWLTLLMLFTACAPVFAEDEDGDGGFTSIGGDGGDISVTVSYGDTSLLLDGYRVGEGLVFIHAVYTRENVLQSIETQEIDLDGAYLTMVNFTEPYSTRSRIFLWKSLDDMQPLEYELNVYGEPYEPADPTAAPSDEPVWTAAPTIAPAPTPAPVRELIAEPLEYNLRFDEATERQSTLIQSLPEYIGADFVAKRYDYVDGGQKVYRYDGFYSQCIDELKSYIDLLSSGKMNYELIPEESDTIGDREYSHCYFQYTGGAKDMNVDTEVWVHYNSRGLDYVYVFVPLHAEYTDLGYRADGTRVAPNPSGESAMEGVYRNTDGSFETTDGRLRTTLGHAAIIRDGEYLTGELSSDAYIYLSSVPFDRLEVSEYSGNEKLRMDIARDAAQQERFYNFEELKGGYYYWADYQANNYSVDYPSSMRPTIFAEWAQPLTRWKWIFPFDDSSYRREYFYNPECSYFTDLSVRVMYYKPNDAAIYYIYSEKTIEPYSLEAFCAVDLSDPKMRYSTATPTRSPSAATPAPVVTPVPTPAPTPTPAPAEPEKHTCTVCHGSGKCQKCNGTGIIQRYAAGGGTIKSTCTQCGGSGKCYFCGGTGRGYY